MLYADCGELDVRPAPHSNKQMRCVHMGKHRPIRVYRSIKDRFMLEDFFAQLQLFVQR